MVEYFARVFWRFSWQVTSCRVRYLRYIALVVHRHVYWRRSPPKPAPGVEPDYSKQVTSATQSFYKPQLYLVCVSLWCVTLGTRIPHVSTKCFPCRFVTDKLAYTTFQTTHRHTGGIVRPEGCPPALSRCTHHNDSLVVCQPDSLSACLLSYQVCYSSYHITFSQLYTRCTSTP